MSTRTLSREKVYQYVVGVIRSGEYIQADDELTMKCPNCGNVGHFNVNIKKCKYNCFKCHNGGSFPGQALADAKNWRAIVRGIGSDAPPSAQGRPFAFCSLASTPLMAILPAPVPPAFTTAMIEYVMAKNIYQYCLSRGVTRDQIEEYRVGYKSLVLRAWFPYWDESGEIVYQQGRAVVDTVQPKTISEGENLPLFGRHIKVLRHTVVLVEGVFDHLATPCSYSLQGSNITTFQLEQLRADGVKKAFVFMDPDAGVQGKRICQKLGLYGIKGHLVVMPQQAYKDPADIGVETMTKIVKCLMSDNHVRPQTIYVLEG